MIQHSNLNLSSQLKIIKKYDNRKLYDTQKSNYVTLVDLAKMVRHNEEIKVIENRTKNDITALTLMQIAFENEWGTGEFLPISLLQDTIKQSGTISKYLLKLGLFTKEQMINQHLQAKSILIEDLPKSNKSPEPNLSVESHLTGTIGNLLIDPLPEDTLPAGFSSGF